VSLSGQRGGGPGHQRGTPATTKITVTSQAPDPGHRSAPGAQERGSGAGPPWTERLAAPARLGKRSAPEFWTCYRSYTDCTWGGIPDRGGDPSNAFDYGVLDLEGLGPGQRV
jgi:hypothetical protein